MSPQDILDALSDYGFTDTTTLRKLEKINAALWDIVGREPWPFMEASIDLAFDGTNPYPTTVTTDLVSVLDMMDLQTGRKMQPIRLQEVDGALNLQLLAQDTPVYYYFLASQLRLAPVPSSTMAMRMRYIKKHPALLQTDPESAILIPKEHHEVLLLGSLVKLYDMEDDTDLSVRFQQLYEQTYQNMRQSIWMRQYDRPDHIVITEYSEYDYY